MKRYISFVLVCLLFSSPLSFTFAREKLALEKGRDLANQFLENSLSDEAWKDNNPTISKETLFHTDDENKNSYVEYKISCDSTPDCGFILVNIDGNDVAVPISSPTGNTPSEILSQGSEDEKYYYFSPFDMYSENTISGDIQALDPQKQVDLRDDTKVKGTKEEKEVNKVAHEKLKSELKEAKKVAKEFKKSQEFKEMKEEIQEQILTVPKEEYSFKALDFAFADLPTSSNLYTSPGTSNEFIPGASTTDCPSRIPCYDQFRQNYSGTYGTNCASGCVPTAVAMLFGYYDRNGKPNLIPGTAPSAGTGATVGALVNTLRTIMGTTCTSSYEGGTDRSRTQDAKQYAIDKGYTNSTSSYSGSITPSQVFTHVQNEINADRPIIIHINNPNGGGHAVVGYGYKIPLSSPVIPIVRVNFGWGNRGVNIYNYSTLDQNLSAIWYNGSNNKTAGAVTRFTIN